MPKDSSSPGLARYDKYEPLVEAARKLPRVVTAMAHPCDEVSLESVATEHSHAAAAAAVELVRAGRADSLLTRLASCAVAVLVAAARHAKAAVTV